MRQIEERYICLLTDKYVEIAKLTPTELKGYEDSLKAYRDIKNSIDMHWRRDVKKVKI